jgi:triosephosphate isomerase (TIM)
MSMRRPLIAGNWKMHKTGPEAATFITALKEMVSDVPDVDIMIAPPFTALGLAAEAATGTSIEIGAQNLHWEPKGAYTGEISAQMLNAAGCRYVIIGHSERRQYFGETDRSINCKIDAAAKANLIPVFCIGETES